MTRDSRMTLLGALGLLALCVVYCLPQHPSAGHRPLQDAALHVIAFTGIGLWFGLAGGRKCVFVFLGVFAALLEVLQWWIGGYPRIEWPDINANEAGLVLAALWLWLRPASAGRQ